MLEGILKSIAAAELPYAQARECGGRRLNAGYQVENFFHHDSRGATCLNLVFESLTESMSASDPP
jgi:hypothetical protein